MLKILSTEFRNFLSYGNQWTRFDVTSGIHLVIGEDTDKKRSNGSGKTSCLEPISYGLFGNTIKDLNKSRIINWKNKKECEVKINFIAITGDEIIIHRGMKPNIFDVWVNGNKLETTASVVDFQKEIEETYIGMDFKTFSGIVHSNPNNSISLLSTKKDQKRAFLERLFNLESYSKLGKVINVKLRGLNDTLIVLENDLKHKREYKDSFDRQLIDAKEEFDSINTTGLQNDINLLHVELDALKKVSVFDYDSDQLIKDKDILINQANSIDIEKDTHKTKRTELYAERKSLQDRKQSIGDLTEKRYKVKNAEKNVAELEKINFEDILSNLNKELKYIDTRSDELEQYRVENSNTLAQIRADLSNLPSVDDLIGKSSCPTCGHDVDYTAIKDDTDVKKKELKKRRDFCDTKGIQLIECVATNKENQKILLDDKKNIEDKKILLDKLRLIIDSMDLDGKEKDLEIIDKRLINIDIEIKELDDKIEAIDITQAKIRADIADLGNKIEDYIKALHDIEKKNTIIDIVVEKLEIHKDNKKRFQTRLDTINKSLEEIYKEITKIEDSYNKSNTLKDYLTFIKDSLKDEHVKQYAISSILPILNKQTNHYLSETGHSFYLLLDGWLEAEIRGIGMEDCSFANLSGGESKSIDLAIKFACHDIAKALSTASTNILILDEILDSSIDSYGIQQLVDIVSIKQQEDNLAVYIISHRPEVGDLEFDSVIKVVKEDGYSHLELSIE
jgi:DNA repair exonuclease SbcCD ATPase subunit